MESQDWIVDGQKLVSVKKGNGEKLIIIFPGYSLSASWAIERYEGILDNSTVYALNFPGFHGSDLIDRRLSTALFHKWLLLIMQENNATKVNLIGHSFGARIALLFAKEYPELINSITFIAPVVRVNAVEKWGNILPESIQLNFLNFLLEGNRLYKTAKSLNKIWLLSKSDLKFLELQSQTPESIERMKYYARSIPSLFVSDKTIKMVFDSIKVDLYLSQKDPHCNYKYWVEISKSYSNVEVHILNGGHFGKIIPN